MVLKNFYVLEGLDGAGTTTQLRKIREEFIKRNIPAFITAEPTDNETGKLIRRILSGEVRCPQSTIARMFSADRDDHLFNPEYGIIKHLEDGEKVVSDRYFFSSIAYQTIGYDWDTVIKLNSDFPYPELVIYIDTPAEDCIKRVDSRGSKKEIYEKLDYQKKVRENYEKCFSSLPDDCRLLRIDGTKTIEDISAEILSFIF